ncbi:DUF551 domain-containing protein [Salmonella enterica]|uniref:DUF551 domain-containing protein n=1 Tax=Salmonella enterica TaxID=28901 RepID=UPI001E561641|nr:DUF551 domain-containing protein [Salmonella enterica]
MTTITKEFTKEQLIAKAQEQIAFCRDTKITGEGRTHVNQCSALFEIALASLTTEPDGLKQAVEFYEQVKQENIPVETGAWKDAVNWVLEEACRAAMLQANQRDLSQPVDPQVAEYEQIMLQAGNYPVIPDGWISCSERMPEDEQEVIVHNKLGYRYVSYFDEHSGLFFDMRGGNQMNCIEHILVTHWMPLPAAPEPDQN